MDIVTLLAVLILGVLILGIAVLILLIVYIRNRKTFEGYIKRLENIELRSKSKAAAVLDDAEAQSVQIVRRASKQATKIIQQAELLTEDSKERAVELMEDTYKNLLDRIVSDNLNIFQNISKHIEAEAEKDIHNFRKIVLKKTLIAERALEKELETEKKEIEKKLQEYRDRRIKEAENSIGELIKEIAKQVLGESLTPKQHKELIVKALEEAKSKLVSNPSR